MAREFISLDKAVGDIGKIRVKVFYLTDPKSKEEYETILNSETVEILQEGQPNTDKVGRVFVFLK